MGTRLLMEWPWFPPLASSSNTHYARCIPRKRMQGRYRDGNGMLGRSLKKTVSQNTLPISTTRFTSAAAGTHNPYGLLSAADLLGWSYTWQTWDWLIELFLLRSTSRRAKSTNKQGDLTRRNISTPSKRKKIVELPPESTIAWARGPGRAANQGQSRLKIVLEKGLDGGYKRQLSVKFKAFCQLSVNH